VQGTSRAILNADQFNVRAANIEMNRLPKDPLTPASKREIMITGVASLITGIAFLIFAALTINITHSNGRLGLPAVMLLIGFMVVVGVGFLGAASSIFRGRNKSGISLLSSPTLYFVGGVLFALPLGILALGFIMGFRADLVFVVRLLPLSGLGLLAIRLARIKSKKSSNQSTDPTLASVTHPAGQGARHR
jgi:hypothetical protein